MSPQRFCFWYRRLLQLGYLVRVLFELWTTFSFIVEIIDDVMGNILLRLVYLNVCQINVLYAIVFTLTHAFNLF